MKGDKRMRASTDQGPRRRRTKPRSPALAKVNAGEWGTKGVIATSVPSCYRAVLLFIHQGAAGSKPGIHPRRLELPVGGVQAPAVHSCLPFLLPSPIKSELGLCQASRSLLPTAASLKGRETESGRSILTHVPSYVSPVVSDLGRAAFPCALENSPVPLKTKTR